MENHTSEIFILFMYLTLFLSLSHYNLLDLCKPGKGKTCHMPVEKTHTYSADYLAFRTANQRFLTISNQQISLTFLPFLFFFSIWISFLNQICTSVNLCSNATLHVVVVFITITPKQAKPHTFSLMLFLSLPPFLHWLKPCTQGPGAHGWVWAC